MRIDSNLIIVSSTASPTIEVDSEAAAMYIRFKTGRVFRTLARPAKAMHLAVDLDAKGELLGVEAVGAGSVSLSKILRLALVSAPRLNLKNLRVVACPAP